MIKRQDSNGKAEVISINIYKGGIPKLPIDSVFVYEGGLQGDGHKHEKHYLLEQAVCLQDIEKLEELTVEGYPLFSGTTGENLTVRNLDVNQLCVGTILEFSGGVMLKLTKVRQPCYVLDSINPKLKDDIIGRWGMYAEVLKGGIMEAGESVEVLSNN